MCSLERRTYGLTSAQKDAISDWATSKPLSEVRVFGSRAKGRARIDSDLDVAITATDGNYWNLANRWEVDSERTGLRVAIKQYNSSLTDTVKRYCDEDFSILLFKREE